MVDLQKISLTKDAPAISLSKSEGAGGIIRVNLNWSQGSGKKGCSPRGRPLISTSGASTNSTPARRAWSKRWATDSVP